MDPARFAEALRELLSLETNELRKRIDYIREDQTLDPSAQFATQYADCKLLKGADLTILKYEKLSSAYLENNFSILTISRNRFIKRPPTGHPPKLTLSCLKRPLMDTDPSIEVLSPMFSFL